MRLVARGTLGLAALAGLLIVAAPAEAQIQSCGEGFELFIRNPDIVPDSSGVFHVSGRLLVQFQVIGERADEIEAFALSFGFDIPTGEEVCQLPPQAWATGAYLEAYAMDDDKSDGFFIAINSNGQTSPQADLGVAVHGYDASGTEVARFWGIVRLDHCGGQPSAGCPDADFPDFTMPWPILLPGDGAESPVSGFAFEFNEELSDLRVELNGEDVTAELQEWTDRPQYDQDNMPDGGPGGIWIDTMPKCTIPEVQSCGPLAGPGYVWTQRAMTDADVIRVIATDVKGNIATKEIHIGSSVAGGTIADGLPILQMTFDNSTLPAEPGSTAVFRMTMQNNGGGEGHPFARASVPDGWDYEWVPGHKPVPAGGSSEQEFHVKIPENATLGRQPVRAIIDYRQGSEDKTLESALNVEVVAPEVPIETDEGLETEAESPSLAPVLALLSIAILARRRR